MPSVVVGRSQLYWATNASKRACCWRTLVAAGFVASFSSVRSSAGVGRFAPDVRRGPSRRRASGQAMTGWTGCSFGSMAPRLLTTSNRPPRAWAMYMCRRAWC